MIKFTILKAVFTVVLVLPLATLQAGNPDRVGQAGAPELLINPWARSSGFHGMNSANIRGIESMRTNIAGMAFSRSTEVVFANTQWMRGSGISLNAIGLSQKVGESGVLGVSIMSMSFGDIEITTTALPEGGVGTYRPQFINMGLGYAKAFSNSIFGGFTMRAISESISDVSAQGFAVDAGIQYITGATDNVKFGIALRNIGLPMRYSGDGMAFRNNAPEGDFEMTMEQRTEKFELPSLLNIGGAYDFKLQELHRITLMANFTSNSFTSDQIGGGLEYAFKEYFMVRAGYRWTDGLMKDETRNTAYTGLAAGFTIELPLKKVEEEEETSPTIGLDYSYRTTNPFAGTHTIGARISL